MPALRTITLPVLQGCFAPLARKSVLSATLVVTLFCAPASARLALVIGNSSYPQSPLDNPVKDANAISTALKEAGFEVELLVDQNGDDMRAAIRRFGARLANRKQPSVFYYAGHAMQLAWRNYLLPVDVRLRSARDLNAQAVDLNELMQQLSQASAATGGGSNIVILDACRDNPFGDTVNAARGLTQIDAPSGTLLAYATAPGNVAQDAGAGANGLYTENLLKEMRVEGAKIEDVLKRVRLAVRLQSRGKQVPWESTSLEEDFFFIPPSRKNLAAEKDEKLFQQELARWEVARVSMKVADLEHYIRDFPSGRFSELAQYRLDTLLDIQKREFVALQSAKEAENARVTAESDLRMLRVREQQIVAALASADAQARRAASLERESLALKQAEAEREARLAREQEKRAADPEFTAVPAATPEPGSIAELMATALAWGKEESRASDVPVAKPGEIRRGWQNGDLLVYREVPMTGLFQIPYTVRQRAYGVSSTRVVMRSGLILDHFSYPRGTMGGDIASTDMQMLVRDYQVGKTWSTRFKIVGSGGERWIEARAKVLSREAVDTSAGRFETYKVSIVGEEITGTGRKLNQTWWIDSISRKPVAYEKIESDADGRVRDHRKGVLLSFENDGRIDQD